ncbi:protein SIEVE ELEMENT OCCLUSION A-like [Camellia sinensis]|uniref:protein SIEVE ELEMENT OCCLUSION A-like n=1 Tax=Camellia sinensis TaxID=4442 RepID=UPI001035DDC8|nr:protein SIEVE ELEMENT OCCLUSION A-like [Camellia sinensis]
MRSGTSTIVSIDPQGTVVNHNAIYMCWICGNRAFPFSSMREEALWEKMPWTIESLAGYIVLQMASEKYICLYGGEDLDWIRSFTNTAKVVAKATQIPLELLYVGKSNPRRKVVKINNVIMVEKLNHTMPDLILIWHFWDRCESMWHSKKQHGQSVGNDPIMKEIKSILSFDKSDQGWAMISRGGTIEMAKAKGNTILKSLNQFKK